MLKQTPDGILLSLKIIPKSKNSCIMGWENEQLKIRIAAIPEKGEANRELIRFLAKSFGIGQSNIILVKGASSRQKCICITGIEIETLRAIIIECSKKTLSH